MNRTNEHEQEKCGGRYFRIRDTINCTGEPFLMEFTVLDLI